VVVGGLVAVSCARSGATAVGVRGPAICVGVAAAEAG
jgi:hypothetical protein